VSAGGIGAGHERIDFPARPILGFAVLLTAVVLAALGALRWQLGVLSARSQAAQPAPHPLAEEAGLPPAPRLLADPGAYRAEYEREQRERLETPAWIDRGAGIVRIPLERAIEKVLEEGLPTR
jgi:hypothetical protein